MANKMPALEWLRRHAHSERSAKFVYFRDVMKLAPAESAEKSGYSSGLSSDPKKRRANLMAAACRANNSERVRLLRMKFEKFQTSDDAAIASEAEVKAALTQELRSAKGASKVNAARALADLQRRQPSNTIDPKNIRMLIDAACSHSHQLVQLLGVATGRQWRDAGEVSMLDWQVPAELMPMDDLMKTTGLNPIDVLKMLHAGGPI